MNPGMLWQLYYYVYENVLLVCVVSYLFRCVCNFTLGPASRAVSRVCLLASVKRGLCSSVLRPSSVFCVQELGLHMLLA